MLLAAGIAFICFLGRGCFTPFIIFSTNLYAVQITAAPSLAILILCLTYLVALAALLVADVSTGIGLSMRHGHSKPESHGGKSEAEHGDSPS
jgi:hypothetical protein